jgi:hypothetical protein
MMSIQNALLVADWYVTLNGRRYSKGQALPITDRATARRLIGNGAAHWEYQAVGEIEAKPDEQKPDKQKSDKQKPDKPKPDKPKLVEPKPDEQKPDEQKPDEQKPDEQKPDEQKPDEPEPDEPEPDETGDPDLDDPDGDAAKLPKIDASAAVGQNTKRGGRSE